MNIPNKKENLGLNGYCDPNSIVIIYLIKDKCYCDVCSYENHEEIIFLCSV